MKTNKSLVNSLLTLVEGKFVCMQREEFHNKYTLNIPYSNQIDKANIDIDTADF